LQFLFIQSGKLVAVEKPVQTVLEKVEGWLDTFIRMLPNMAVALLLFLIFLVLAKFGRKFFIKLFSKASENKALENLFSTFIHASILGIGLFIILGVLGLDKAVTSLLAGIGVVGLALGFAFQDIAANFVSGIILAFRRPFNIGDIIGVKETMGKVSRTNLRATIIETFQGQEVYVPNKSLLQEEITNYTVLKKRRIDLAVGVSYGDDLDKVETLVLSTIKRLEGVIDHDKIIFDYGEFGSSSIDFTIRFWIDYPSQPGYLAMRHKAIKAIKKAFDQEQITIPFPIRTLDFGIKGGEKLSAMKLSLNGKSIEEEEA
jgi:small conductance mechanosensitive channel